MFVVKVAEVFGMEKKFNYFQIVGLVVKNKLARSRLSVVTLQINWEILK